MNGHHDVIPPSLIFGCEGKLRHASRKIALGMKRVMAQHRGANVERLNAYKCKHCGGWHLGNSRRKILRAIRGGYES